MTAIYKWDFPEKEPFRQQLVKAICEEFAIQPEDLTGTRSFHHLVDARSVYAYLCREHLRDTYMRIGIDLGNRSHATVINLLQRLKDLIYVKDKVANKLRAVEQKILTQSI